MFTGFTAEHFDAYQESKWRSRAFNLERMAVKDQLAALGRAIGGGLVDAGGAPLAMELSVEHPALWNQKQVDAQHLYFARAREARREIDQIVDRARGMAALIEDPSPQRSHVLLTASLALDHVYAGFKLHRDASVDRDNLTSKLDDPSQAQDFIDRLAALPPDIHIGIAPGDSGEPARDCTLERVRQLMHELSAPLAPGKSRWLTVGRRFDRARAVELGATLARSIDDVLRAVLPVYHYVAWTRDNDHIAMRGRLHERSVAQKQRGLSKNDTVRVTTGMFAGRTGVVQDIDSEGMVKVRIGSVPVTLEADAVERQ